MRRFGWSEVSQEAAEAHARERAEEALRRLLSGEYVRNRDPKVVYGGAHGLPIREQVILRKGPDVVTRNAYGARCLNVPDVLFADIDRDQQPIRGCAAMIVLGVTVVVAVLLAVLEVPHAVPVATIALLALAAMAWWNSRATSHEQLLRHVQQYAASRPNVRFAVYETPAGLRVLALHRTFDPGSDEVQTLFLALRTDRIYARMCALQACFRARVSPKPWRMGMAEHIRPRPGIWPVRVERRPEREAWIARYEELARGFAACRFLGVYGSGPVDPRCAEVQRMHDEMCCSDSDLPLA